MKKKKEVVRKVRRANYAPIYAAALYPDLASICIKHGYALAVHGSLARDFDLIAVAWAKKVSKPSRVIDEIKSKFGIEEVGKAGKKNHGRIAHTLSIGFGECFLDLSFIN